MKYVVKYKDLPDNLLVVQIELNEKTIIYINKKR